MSESQHVPYQKSTAGKVKGEKKTPDITPAPDQHPLIALQRLIGNHAVTQMLGVQAKLTVGAADDAYEAEADNVANQVMTMRVDKVQRADDDEIATKRDIVQRADDDEMAAKRVDVVQRAEEDELAAKRLDIVQRAEEDELAAKRDLIQRADDEELAAKRSDVMRADGGEGGVDMMQSFDVGGDIENRINKSSGGGQPLDEGARSFMEPRFGQDFSNVRVHADSEANDLNNSIQAKAFTKGTDIFFKSGEYQPESSSGKELLAHELTHVVQQTGGK